METKVLDHGYVKLIEKWGSDQRIVEAARMSTDKGFLGWDAKYAYECYTCVYTCVLSKEGGPMCPNCHTGMKLDKHHTHKGDLQLLKYLYQHRHDTPFEMAGMIVEVQAPIIVFREWHRHRTQSYNEMSGRYVVLPNLYYVPSIERLKMSYQSSTNKQSSTEAPWDETQLKYLQEAFRQSQIAARGQYEELLSSGVSREVARLVLPVSQYSRMRASANLRNWLAFLTLRCDTRAQWEIHQYAHIVAEYIKVSYPRTYDLFVRTEQGIRKVV